MSVGLIDLDIMDDIANAINAKLSSSGTMTPSEMATNISNIHTSSEVKLGAGSFSSNGVYPASSDNLDGYSTVTVSLPLDSITVTENKTYYASSYNLEGFNEVVVDTPVTILTNLNVNTNSVYTASSGYGYDVVSVDVPNTYSASDEGKVVSNGVLSVQTSSNITANTPTGTYIDTTTISQVTVDVATGGGSDYDPFSGTDVVESVTAYCNEINSSTGSTTFYTTYSNSRINVLTISASTSVNREFQNLNATFNPNQVLFNKLILDSTVLLTQANQTSYSYSGHMDIKEAVVECPIDNSGVLGRIFYGCSALKKLDMQNAIITTASVGNVLFDCVNNCSSLKEIKLPSNIIILGESFACNCYSLKTINTDNIKYFFAKVFQNCYSLQKLNLNSLTDLGVSSSKGSTFTNSGLEEVNMPNLENWLGTSDFSSCKNLRKVISLGTQITSIPGNSFQYCINLKTVPIPNTVTSIGSSAFQGCKALKNIIIPAEVTTIGSNAFYDCISLDWIQFLSTTPPTVQYSSTFQNIPTTCKIYVPTGTLSDYTSANNYPSSSTYTYIEGSPPST